MRQRYVTPVAVVLFLLAVAAWVIYMRRDAELPPEPPPEDIHLPGPRTVTATVSRPLQREITDYEEFTGQTEPGQTAEVRARVNGKVDKVRCRAGDSVKMGDRLFEIDPKPFQAALEKAEADVKRHEGREKQSAAAYEKAEKDREAGKLTQKELEKVRRALEQDEAALEEARSARAQARRELDGTQVTAPIAGVVDRLLVMEGGRVSADSTVLATVAAIDPIAVHVEVDEPIWLRIRQRCREAKVALQGQPLVLGLAGETGFPHRGTVVSVEPPPQPKTGRARLRGAFPNTDGSLSPGRTAWVRLPLGKPYAALLVDDDVVIREGRQHYLFVVNARNVVEQRPVKLGPLHEGLQVIEEGISPRDWVVVTGVLRVQKGDTVVPNQAPMPEPPPTPRVEPDEKNKEPKK